MAIVRRSLRPAVALSNKQEGGVSTRGNPEVQGEGVGGPGVPGSLAFPSDALYSPAEREAMAALQEAFPQLKGEKILRALQVFGASIVQSALDKFSVFTQIKPFTNFEVMPIVLAAGVASPIDPPNQQVNRRTLFLINPSAADVVWVNKTQQVAVNNGIPIAANNGSYAVSMIEYIQHWAICVAGNTLMSVWYT